MAKTKDDFQFTIAPIFPINKFQSRVIMPETINVTKDVSKIHKTNSLVFNSY
jgi:hypothetical protein